MPSIEGLTNPFENSVLNLNLTQLEKDKQIANYSSALAQGYEPPAEVLAEIAALLDAGILSPDAVARLEELTEQIMAEIGPIITSDGGGDTTSITIDENSTVVTTVAALDQYSANDGTEALSYSIVGGVDSSLFQINAITGELTFIAPPDYELPVGGDNIYDVTVQVNDGATLLDTQTITVTVADLNDTAPVITSVAEVTIDENTTAVTQVTTTDADTVGTLSYALQAGGDAALFTIDTGTGVLALLNPADFEVPDDANADGTYDVTIVVSDGVQSTTQAMQVTVADVNEAPPFVVTADTAAVKANGSVLIDVLHNDGEAGGPALQIASITQGANGDVTLHDNGTLDTSDDYLSYATSNDFVGTDTFTYTASDGLGGMVTTTVTVQIGPDTNASVIDDYATVTAGVNFDGLSGNTHIAGTTTDDTINGDAFVYNFPNGLAEGHDVIQAGDGNDTINGDYGRISTYHATGAPPVQVAGDDELDGGAGDDTMFGDASTIYHQQTYYGADVTIDAGDDILNGGTGTDLIYGDGYGFWMDGVRSHVSYAAPTSMKIDGGNDLLDGGAGDDMLWGDAHRADIWSNDPWDADQTTIVKVITGGDDRLNGGSGNDQMWGDFEVIIERGYTVTTGADTFVFTADSGNDTIHDFQRGLDTIEVAGYSLTDFTQLNISASGADTIVQFDASNSVTVINVTGMDVDDFLFV